MAILIEDHLPVVKYNGLNTAKTIVATGSVDFSGASSFVFPANTTGGTVRVSFTGQTTEAATDRTIFLADRAYIVTAAYEIHAVAAGGASALQLVKDTGTTAPGAGTDLLTNNTNTGFDLNGTANTLQTGTLVATTATLTLAAGDRLSIDFANTIQSTAGLSLTVVLRTV